MHLAKGANTNAGPQLKLFCWDLPFIGFLWWHGNIHMGQAVVAAGSEVWDVRDSRQWVSWPHLPQTRVKAWHLFPHASSLCALSSKWCSPTNSMALVFISMFIRFMEQPFVRPTNSMATSAHTGI